MRLREALAGRRMLVTGVTGFVGEALLERVLSDLPETRVVALVRPRAGRSARGRVEQLLRKPAFAGLRDRIGADGVARLLTQRIEVVEGDLDALPPLPGDLDVVVHCAGEVAFDPPIHQGFAVNCGGVERLLAAVRRSGSQPHVVQVSTAYVGGLRHGPVAEERLDHAVSWRAEAAAADRLRDHLEDASRTPAMLARLRRQASREHGRSGPQAVAAEAERRRREWVTQRLVDAGRERGQSLGWTDCYTFTKAMGERAAEELAGDLPLSIVRPSIIESALTRPFPGWIQGFKMAEPLILAYGRGELPDIPAVPDAILDVIPVDLVVATLLAVAARPPPPGRPAYYHSCSGGRNPLTFKAVHEHVTSYFQAAPLEARGLGAVALPTWRFPGPDRVEVALRTGERSVAALDAVVSRLPRSTRTREAVRRLDRQRGKLEFLRRYMDLYRPYTTGAVTYLDDHVQDVEADLDPADRQLFVTDPTTVDWRHYLVDVHCPSVSGTLRALGRRPRPRATRPGLDVAPGRQVLAAFDMDGTLLSTNVVESFLALRLADAGSAETVRAVAGVARDLPGWLLAERRDRAGFLRAVYRRYAGASMAGLERLVDDELAADLLASVAPAAVRRVREHRAAGHRVVLITGAIRPLTRPLAPLFDDIAAAELVVRDGRCTGFLTVPPLVGEARAAWLRRYAGRHDLELDDSYAYADSDSDLPMLRAVGHPVAVNPDTALLRVARRGRWPVEDWPSGRRHRPVAAVR